MRTLIHQYSLPFALIGTVAAVDAISSSKFSKEFIRKYFIWIFICWGLLAKPWFFTGPYLTRVGSISSTNEAIGLVPESASVLTNSYLVPHLTHRASIKFSSNPNKIDLFDIILFNPLDPGWSSESTIQKQFLEAASRKGWYCKAWPDGLELCSKTKLKGI